MCIFRSVFGIVGVIISSIFDRGYKPRTSVKPAEPQISYYQHNILVLYPGSGFTYLDGFHFDIPDHEHPIAHVKIRKAKHWSSDQSTSDYTTRWGAAIVTRLIERADDLTPAEIRDKTRVVVCDVNGNHRIEDGTRNSIARMGYQKPDPRICKRMSQDREGIYFWFAFNVVTDRLQYRTLGVIYIQEEKLTVVTERFEWQLNDTNKAYYTKVHVPGRKNRARLYKNSLPDAGLLSGRLGIFKREPAPHAKHLDYSSVCFRPDVDSKDFWIKKRRYVVGGRPPAPDEDRAAKCLELAKNQVKGKVTEPPPVSDFRYVGPAFLYDVVKRAGFAGGKNDFAGDMTVGQFLWAAKRACSGEAYLDQPWACVDFMYIYAFLHDGLKLYNETIVTGALSLNGVWVSRALGYAYTQVIADLTPDLTNLIDEGV